MKKKILLPLLFCPFLVLSQNFSFKPDARLYEVYEARYIDDLAKTYPLMIGRWNYYLQSAWFISDGPPKKRLTGAYLSVKITDLASINILKLEKEQNLTHEWDEMTVYRIEGTDKHLVYFPGKIFVENLKSYLQSVKN